MRVKKIINLKCHSCLVRSDTGLFGVLCSGINGVFVAEYIGILSSEYLIL